MKTYRLIATAALILLPLLSNGQGQVKIGTGIDFSSGGYGDAVDTDILYLPLNLSYSSGPWEGKVTLPWLQIKGPGTVIGGGDGGVVIGDGDSEVTTESGIGDIWTSLTYSVEAIPAELFFLDLVGKVKIPTADDERGLGTGEVDYTLQADLFKPFGKLTAMGTVAYKIKGDLDGIALDNVFFLSVGADYRYSEEVNFGLTLDYQEASTASSDDATELFGYLGYRLSDDWMLMVYSYAGLSDGSPDSGGGFQVSFTM